MNDVGATLARLDSNSFFPGLTVHLRAVRRSASARSGLGGERDIRRDSQAVRPAIGPEGPAGESAVRAAHALSLCRAVKDAVQTSFTFKDGAVLQRFDLNITRKNIYF